MTQPDTREPNARLIAVGLRIATARRELGMRQEDIAEKVGLSRSSIRRRSTPTGP